LDDALNSAHSVEKEQALRPLYGRGTLLRPRALLRPSRAPVQAQHTAPDGRAE